MGPRLPAADHQRVQTADHPGASQHARPCHLAGDLHPLLLRRAGPPGAGGCPRTSGTLSETNKVPLLFGSPTYEIKQPRKVMLRNSAFLLSADGEVAARYDKFHLVPFGEYVPLKSVLFFVEKMVQAIGDFGTGSDYTVMTVFTGSPEPAIPSSARLSATRSSFRIWSGSSWTDGAGIVTTITNDAWFGRTAAPLPAFFHGRIPRSREPGSRCPSREHRHFRLHRRQGPHSRQPRTSLPKPI